MLNITKTDTKIVSVFLFVLILIFYRDKIKEMKINNYLTVFGETEKLNIIERSKFICYAKGVENENEAKSFIEKIRKMHSLATHNCYAYIADEKGNEQKFSDDGEPQGTAGVPMLEVLKNRKIYKTVVVVTRYFGGIKLGAGGLVRAYSGAVSDCLNDAKIVNMIDSTLIRVKTEYDGYSKLLKIVDKNICFIKNTTFGNSVLCDFVVKTEKIPHFIKLLADVFSGREEYEILQQGYFAF